MKHGRAELKRFWSLDGADARKKKKRLEEAALANRQCPSCFSITAPAPKCPCCGYIYTVKERQIQQIDGSLTELSVEQLDRLYLEGLAKKKARQTQGKAKSADDLRALGYSEGRIRHILAAREAKKLSQSA
jgi:hypothetical protein